MMSKIVNSLLIILIILLSICFYLIEQLNLRLDKNSYTIEKIVVDSLTTYDFNDIINNFKKINTNCFFDNIISESHTYNNRPVDEISFKCY